jgi:hypothetical protein
MQMRQKELAIRLASEPGPANCDLPLPFPGPFFPEPLSNLRFTGQKPRTLTRSLNLLRASWYVEYPESRKRVNLLILKFT